MGYSLWTTTVRLGMFLAAVSCTRSMGESQVSGLQTVQNQESNTLHRPQKRSHYVIPIDDQGDVLYEGDDDTSSQFMEDSPDKRGSLFRFGKRQGSLFRFGKRQGSLFRFGKRQGLEKRGSLLRFGKRQGSLFRFGKRAGSIFRFGRSSSYGIPLENIEDKRTLFRFGRGSNLDLLSQSHVQDRHADDPSYLEDIDRKRAADSFHWGSEYDNE